MYDQALPRRRATTRRLLFWCVAVGLGVGLVGGAALPLHAADQLGAAISRTEEGNRAARVTQQRIDQLDDETRKLFERYRSATAQSAQLELYTQQLQQLLSRQQAEQASLQTQLTDIDQTERQLWPLMLQMLDSLQKFISLDLPFLVQERSERLASLQRVMADSATPIAEKYRRLLEAYQIEAQYGRTLGAERLTIDDRSFDVLRVGRLALFELTPDGHQAGLWDPQAKQWRPLQAKWCATIATGLRIARESSTPQTLILPLPVPTSATATPAGAP
jgi:hypothetical protein